MMNGAMKVELLEHVLSPEVCPNIKGYNYCLLDFKCYFVIIIEKDLFFFNLQILLLISIIVW